MRDQTFVTSGATGSGQRDHLVVDLTRGWSTDVLPTSSTAAQGDSNAHDTFELKRSPSRNGSALTINSGAPQFASISFPKKDATMAASLYTGITDDNKEDLERIRRLPPSKRPGVSHAKKTPPNHIKRPRNAYIIFRSHTVSQKLIPKEVEHDHRNISRIIAHMWKSLAPEDRAFYEQIAKEEKERHKQLFPDYKYQPTTRRTGVNKRNVKKLENGEEECQEIADIILKAQGKDGVVVRPEKSCATKRAREAMRPSLARAKTSTAAPYRKRAKVATLAKIEHPPTEQMLETVFLHPSPSNSPTSASSSGIEAVHMPSPEPFRLASRTPSIDQGQAAASPELIPHTSSLLGRRASSVPLFRPCSPPPPFELETQQSHQEAHTTEAQFGKQNGWSSDVAHTSVGFSDELVMPAPSWKGRRAQPPPIPNTWQLCSHDDQSLPSPRSLDAPASSSKNLACRPHTALPTTPSSGSFRGFFHPWAYEQGNESMLVSPMTTSFQDWRRRSSLARADPVASRRPGSFGFDAHGNAGGRTQIADVPHSLISASEPRMSDAQLFVQAARAAAISLEAEVTTGELVEDNGFAFDPALEGEGCEPMASSSFPAQAFHRVRHTVQSPIGSPGLTASSPRPSFSGSTLAAAARDWASIKRRQSKMVHRSVIEPVGDSLPASTETLAYDGTRIENPQREGDKSANPRTMFEESVERAVMLALGKESGSGSDRGERNSRIVQQILSSLSAELSLQQPSAYPTEQTTGVQAHNQRPTASKAPSPIVESSRRTSLRGSCGAASPFKPSQYLTGNAAARPLPSPLQLVMSNHEMCADVYSQSYSSSQHCN